MCASSPGCPPSDREDVEGDLLLLASLSLADAPYRMLCADVPDGNSPPPPLYPPDDACCLTKMVTAAPSAVFAQTSHNSSSSMCRPSPPPIRVRKKVHEKNSSSPMCSFVRMRSLIAAGEVRPARLTTERDSWSDVAVQNVPGGKETPAVRRVNELGDVGETGGAGFV